MIVVKPIPVTDESLLAAQINEPDSNTGEIEWVAGTYNKGDQRIKSSTHRIYEVVADPSTSDDPEVGVDLDPPSWIDVGATNRWRMFDNTVSSQTTGANINVFIENQPIITSVSGFNISGTDLVKVQLLTDTGFTYERDIIMQDDSVVGGWWDYFFEPIVAQTRFIITDLPMYPNTQLIVRTYGDEVAFGELIIGRGQNIGTTQHGTGWQGLDFSVKERNQFGEFTVVQGLTADLLDYDIKVEKTRFGYVKGILKSLTGIPTVWIGNPSDTNDGTAVFGYYRDAQINFTSPSIIDMTVQVEGLV